MLLSRRHKTASSDHLVVGGKVGQVKLHTEDKSVIRQILIELSLDGKVIPGEGEKWTVIK